MRLRLITLVCLAGLAVPSAALAASPTNGIGIRLVTTAADSSDPLARSYIVARLRPGATLRRRVEIRNNTPSSARVSVYVAAASLRGGVFDFGGGRSSNELSSWTNVSQHVLRMRAGGDTYVTVTVKVPKAGSSGERYAVVWAEVSAANAGGVTLVNRVGVRMYVSIGPGGAPRGSFAIGKPSARRSADGKPLVLATVRNNGKRILDIGGTLTLTNGPGGLRAGPFPVDLGAAIAPMHSRSATVALDRRLPSGPWRAEIHLNSGFIQHSAVATITFPPAVASARAHGWLRMLVLAALLVLLLACATLLFRRSRMHRPLPI